MRVGVWKVPVKTLVGSLVALGAYATATWFAVSFESFSPATHLTSAGDLIYLPTPAQARLMSLGYENAVADFYWVKALQYYTDQGQAANRYKNLADYLDLVIGVDPDYEYAYKFAGLARDKIGTELKLVDESKFVLAWIVDFPFYEWNEEDKKIDFAHNPFSMPQGGEAALDAAATDEAKLKLKAFQYDIVCNGFEIASGGIRNHEPGTMIKAFGAAGHPASEVENKFGGMYRAFQYGAPPHGGMAAGIDRMVMLLVGAKNLREISLFPMNQQAEDLLMGAPTEATPKQLRELSVRVAAAEKKG